MCARGHVAAERSRWRGQSCGAGGRRPEQAGCGEVALHGRDGAGDGGAGGAPGSHHRRESPRPSAPSARAGAGTAWAAPCRGLPRCHGLLWCHQLCWCLAPHQHLVPRPGCWLPSVSLTSTSALLFLQLHLEPAAGGHEAKPATCPAGAGEGLRHCRGGEARGFSAAARCEDVPALPQGAELG